MNKRPLCFLCVLFLLIQAVRVYLTGMTGEEGASPLERAVAERQEAFLEVPARATARGYVSRIEEKKKVTAVYLKNVWISFDDRTWQETDLLVYIGQNQEIVQLKIGNAVEIEGEIEIFDGALNPGNFDQRLYYRRMGIHELLWAENIRVLSGRVEEPAQTLSEIRAEWKRLLVSSMGEYYGNTMSAVLLGEKGGLDAEMKKLYQKNGIGHLLAISGLHMSFIGMGIYGILRKAGLSFLPAGIAGGGILILYTMMIGTGVSALRALIMFLVRVGADIFGRVYDLPTSLALAAAIVCGWNPLYLTDAAFLLSFGAILGITLCEPVFSEMLRRGKEHKIWGKIAPGLASSLAVTVFLMGPVLYFYFEVPPCSVFLNLIVIPIMPAAMGAGIAGSALSVISKPLGKIVFLIAEGVLRIYDAACGVFVKLPGSRYVSGQPKIWWLAAYYAVLLLILVWFYRKKRKEDPAAGFPEEGKHEKGKRRRLPGIVLTAWAVTMCAVCRNSQFGKGEIQVTMLDVGQGDGFYIRGPSGKNYLIDGGSSDVSSVGTYRIEPFLLSKGIGELDYVFLTHGDGDHTSGVTELLEGQKLGVRIRTLVLLPEEYVDESLLEIARTAEKNGTRVTVMEVGEEVAEGEMTLSCLGPDNGLAGEAGSNAVSLVLGLSFGQFDMLFTGDLEGEGEESLLESGELREYDLLKAAHHGSKNSTSERFLEEVRPSAALISAGRGNRYGHPHEETLQRLEEAGAAIYSTIGRGAVTVKSDGSNYSVLSNR